MCTNLVIILSNLTETTHDLDVGIPVCRRFCAHAVVLCDRRTSDSDSSCTVALRQMCARDIT